MSPDEFRIMMWFDEQGRFESGSIAAYSGGEKVSEIVPPSAQRPGPDLHAALETLLKEGLDTWGVQGTLFG